MTSDALTDALSTAACSPARIDLNRCLAGLLATELTPEQHGLVHEMCAVMDRYAPEPIDTHDPEGATYERERREVERDG